MTGPVPVVWMVPRGDVPARGYWDQQLVEDLFSGVLWRPVRPWRFEHVYDRVPASGGCVAVLAASTADPVRVAERIGHLDWCLLVLTSDEECRFNLEGFLASMEGKARLRVWKQYTDRDRAGVFPIPVGYAPNTPAHAAAGWRPTRYWRAGFNGQITHPRREQLAAQMRPRVTPEDRWLFGYSEGFAQGKDHADYMDDMGDTLVAACPPGPLCPDTFRLWEALEAGCVPVVDRTAGERDSDGYWRRLCPDAPFPIVNEWDELPAIVDRVTGDGLARAECSAWWQQQKRALVYRLADDVAALSGSRPEAHNLADLVTVVVPTSPIPSHPDTAILRETAESLWQAGLEGCEVIVTCDGVRAEQEHRREAYEEYVSEVVRLCEHEWGNVVPVVHRSHEHQARMMRQALPLVRTPCVLYVEHDAPLVGPIDWQVCADALLAGAADLIRFHHEAQVLEPHAHLMPGPVVDVGGAAMQATVQWSQRPHLARVDYYQRILADHFQPGERHMIEDMMHSVVECAWNDDSWAGWDRHRLFLYSEPDPQLGIKRSTHLDGRGDDPKWTDR